MWDSLISFAGGVLVATAGLLWNFRNAREQRKQPFLVKQLELCVEASTVAATLATSRSAIDFERAHARFLELFWGPLSIVESPEVSLAMRTFREKLRSLIAAGTPLPLRDLQDDSYDLAREVRGLILGAWKINDLGDLLERGSA